MPGQTCVTPLQLDRAIEVVTSSSCTCSVSTAAGGGDGGGGGGGVGSSTTSCYSVLLGYAALTLSIFLSPSI